MLPFADLSPDGDQAYFSDGVAEEILNLVAQVRELRVISRSSAFRYRGEFHIPTVAEELDVSYVLEGSVRKSGDRVRVTAQLIDARADAHVWSENFDGATDGIFAIQDDIARRIVDDLKIHLAGSEPRSVRTDPETYQLYLQARHLMEVEQTSSELAEDLLQQALERDGDYLPALILIVKAVFWHTGNSEDDRYTFDKGIARMRGYVDRALAIAPGNSAALAHRGWMAFWYGNDLETFAEYLNRALQNDPDDEWVLYVAMVNSRFFGRNEDAIAFARARLQRDPLCSGCLYNWMEAAMSLGRYDEALAEVQAWIGNVDSAFEWLGRYLDPDQPNFIQVLSGALVNPFLRNLHDDPRWRELREQADMSEERLAKIRIEMPP